MSALASPRSRVVDIAFWVLAGAVGLIVGVLLQQGRVREARADATAADRALQAARLEATLSAAVIEAQSGRYEVARQRASDFYTGVQRQLLPVLTDDERAEARQMLTTRDSLITSLARNDPASSGALAAALVQFRETVRRAGLDSSTVSSGQDE